MILVFIFLRALFITIFLESVCLWCWHRATKRNLLMLLLINIITNQLLLIIMTVARLKVGYVQVMYIELFLEAIIVIAEALIIKSAIKDIEHPFLFSLSANLLSYVGGRLLVHCLTGFMK